MLFRTRRDAGLELASSLRGRIRRTPLVIAIGRGGVPVAAEVARAFDAPLFVWGARKLRAPSQPDLVIGAVAEGGGLFLNRAVLKELSLSEEALQPVIADERALLEAQSAMLPRRHRPPTVEASEVVLVDDGVLTGSTVRAVVRGIRAGHPSRIVLALPLACYSELETLREEVDEVVCLHPRRDLSQLTVWFRKPEPISDDDLARILREADERWRQGEHARELAARSENVEVHATYESVAFAGLLTVPAEARGLVVWGHGHRGHARGQRTQHVARALQRSGLATLLVEPPATAAQDWPEERIDSLYRAATAWARQQAVVRGLPIAFLAVGGAAAAALRVAADAPSELSAVVVEEARLDLVADILTRVTTPTRLIVGENDATLRASYRGWVAPAPGSRDLVLIPGATYLFAEPGALGEATRAAQQWFLQHLPTQLNPPPHP